jgi:hypothetical protein
MFQLEKSLTCLKKDKQLAPEDGMIFPEGGDMLAALL